jgi:hypothetical protein
MSGDLTRARSVDAPAERPSLVGAKVFVAAIFTLLGAGFLASTALLFFEFQGNDPVALALMHSHLFVFFPTFGILALCAFFIPAVVFTHLYWFKLPYGRVRFLFGFAVAIGLSLWVTASMLGEKASPRAVWEVAPVALAADRGEPANCTGNTQQSCARAAFGPALQSLRDKAQVTASLSKFGRSCAYDKLLEVPETHTKLRWCFPAGRMTTTETCCAAQAAFTKAVAQRVGDDRTRSNLARADVFLQPIKIFFVLVVLVIAVLLVIWQRHVEVYYPDLSGKLERHIAIGAIAMLLWPVMDYAYLDTTNALFGRLTDDLQPRLSLVVAPWALLLMFYYLKRFARRVEVIGQIVGVAGGLLAVIARDELKDWAVRIVGVGMPTWMFFILALAWIAGMAALFLPPRLFPQAAYDPVPPRA